MCIVLFTTAHPAYALILIDNRDEFILRPTSRPSWWRHPTTGDEVLSARDLHRADRGTWLGITRRGALAVLTNYRERAPPDGVAPGGGSRGRVTTAWLGGLADHGLGEGVQRLVQGGRLVGVGGFSMVGGKLRRENGSIAVVSNRARQADDVPLIGLEKSGTWGLSNTTFDSGDEWPKVVKGKRLLSDVVSKAVETKADQEELIRQLFEVLNDDTLPPYEAGTSFDDYLFQLRNTILVPLIGDATRQKTMREASARGRGQWSVPTDEGESEGNVEVEGQGDAAAGVFETGMYGTQRQTVLLVDHDGRVTLVERALWDQNGNALARGEGDVVFQFDIDGWGDEE